MAMQGWLFAEKWTARADLVRRLTSRWCARYVGGAQHAAGLGPVSPPSRAAAPDWRHRLDIDLVYVTREVPVNSLPLTTLDAAHVGARRYRHRGAGVMCAHCWCRSGWTSTRQLC